MAGTLAVVQKEVPKGRLRGGTAPRRRFANGAWWAVCSVGLLLVIAPVVWIVGWVVQRAAAGWHWSVLTEVSTGVGGGLANAIVGTLVIMFGVAVLAGVVGIGGGIFLAEIARPGKLSTVLRSGSEILAGMPSIVFGYVGLLVLVIGLHWQLSLLPALIVVSLLVVPYVAKSTELALNQVPLAYREGGEALGMSKTYLLRRVVLRSAIPGISTGIIVALAISVGETAPLLLTAGYSNQYPSGALLHEQIGYLTYAAYTFYNEPTAAARQLSADAALLLLLLVFILILLSRLIVWLTQKYSPNRAVSRADADRRATRRAREHTA